MNFKCLKYVLLLLIISLHIPFSMNGQSVIDSLKLELKKAKNKEIKIKILNDLSWEIAPTNIRASIGYATKALNLAKENYPNYKAESYTCLGSAFDMHGKYNEAISYYNKSYDAYKSINDSIGMAKVFLNIGASYYYRGIYAKALDYYIQAAKIQRTIKDQQNLAKSYNNIGLVYRTKNENEKALIYFFKSLRIKEKLRDKKGILYSYSNIGIIHQNLKHCDTALWYATETLKLSKEIKSDYDLGTSIVNIGEAYYCMNDLKNAKKFYFEGEKVLLANEDDNNLSFCYKGLGNVFEKENKLEQSLSYYNKAIKYAKENERNELLSDLYHSVYQINEKLQNTETAFGYYKLYTKMKDSVFSIESNRNLNELEIVYETEKQQQQLIEKDNEKKILRNYIIALAFILIFVISSIYIVNKQRKKLASQKQILEKLVDEKNLLLRETHHRVKNNFQIVSSLLYLQSESLENKAAIEALKEAQNRVRSMILIHQRLYNKDEIIGINAQEYLTDLINDLTEYQGSYIKNLQTEIAVEKLVFNIDTITPIGLIVNELITNVFKHAFNKNAKNPMLKVSLHKINDEIELIISDNGKGFVKEPSPESFGIKLIHSLAKKLKGKLSFESKNGTVVTIKMKRFTLV
ncbi:MAG: tetratricopeptide repeat protein [Flavobacterium sp.]|uniref:tetratricopeptide repeat-containing sensor histidine kinase n=1 Tax=Flavobacterium sp. TaxID=239 RepID=UPI00261820CE|nr:tetratricopeptide repeat protein [Flavobacterium sp.]MDD5149592.1 tetratricopeptide repeat protein [Flavobacterium sp.]